MSDVSSKLSVGCTSFGFSKDGFIICEKKERKEKKNTLFFSVNGSVKDNDNPARKDREKIVESSRKHIYIYIYIYLQAHMLLHPRMMLTKALVEDTCRTGAISAYVSSRDSWTFAAFWSVAVAISTRRGISR